MPDKISDMLASAKSTLAEANTFPSMSAPGKAVKPATPAKPAKPVESNLGTELRETNKMKAVGIKAQSPEIPKMHKGGPVMADGDYNLKAGEHVLTGPEAAKARTHALLASGMKSLAKPGRGRATMTITPAPKTFTDKNLDPKLAPGDPVQKVTSPNAKPGGSISPELNAPKQTSTKASAITTT